MPDRALRRTARPRSRPPTVRPNASNARQGIKTHPCRVRRWRQRLRPNASNARQGIKTNLILVQERFPSYSVQTPPMPDRALRLLTHFLPRSELVPLVQTPPMPDRALRLLLWRERPSEFLPRVQTPPMPDRALRRSMERVPRPAPWTGPNASNARQGIKTYRPGARGGIRVAEVQTPPMPDRALRLTAAGKGGVDICVNRSKRLQCPTGH